MSSAIKTNKNNFSCGYSWLVQNHSHGKHPLNIYVVVVLLGKRTSLNNNIVTVQYEEPHE
jgi:hypothetical protein